MVEKARKIQELQQPNDVNGDQPVVPAQPTTRPCGESEFCYVNKKPSKHSNYYFNRTLSLLGGSVHFVKGSVQPRKGEGGVAGILVRDQMIQGIPCAKGSRVEFDGNGQLVHAVLSRNITMHGALFAEGTTVDIEHEEGNIDFSGTLAKDQTIQGIPCSKDTRVSFENGKLYFAILSQNTIIHGILCAKGTEIVVSVSNAGTELHATLAQETTIEGITFGAGTFIDLYYEGGLNSATPAQDQTIQGIPCAKGLPIQLSYGKLREAILARDIVLNGILYTKGTGLTLDRAGQVTSTYPPSKTDQTR